VLLVPPSLLPYLFGEKKDYSSLQDVLIRVNVVFIVLVVSAAGLRFFVRFRMLRSAGLDDGKHTKQSSTGTEID
jgi:hypothetical protein